MNDPTPRILIIGAHPDDADVKAGGTAALWRDAGCVVQLVSLTDGRAGHHVAPGPALAKRRRAEALAAGAVLDVEYMVLDVPDGELDDRLEYRHQIIRLVRRFRPDLIITHRTIDYHPDHRFTGQLVQDAAYLLTVPAVCPDVPHLPVVPVILFFQDGFTRPCPFQPSVVVDIAPALDRVVAMLDCHVSQFYEWLPYNAGHPEEVPADANARRAWLGQLFRERIAPLADQYRDLVLSAYGPEVGPGVAFIEAFEVSEQGSSLDAAARRRLFPFLPESGDCGKVGRKRWVDRPAES